MEPKFAITAALRSAACCHSARLSLQAAALVPALRPARMAARIAVITNQAAACPQAQPGHGDAAGCRCGAAGLALLLVPQHRRGGMRRDSRIGKCKPVRYAKHQVRSKLVQLQVSGATSLHSLLLFMGGGSVRQWNFQVGWPRVL